MPEHTIIVDGFVAYTLGMLTYLVGVQLTAKFAWLRSFNIPEPVSGGMLAALVAVVIFTVTGYTLEFELETRDRLLVYFFTAIGLNADLRSLLAGGRVLVVLLVATLAYIVVQNLVGVGASRLLDLPREFGVLAGSTSLIGGHGTAIAWAPEFAERPGLSNALEIGVACSTLGLVLASVLGGPLARFMMRRGVVRVEPESPAPVLGLQPEEERRSSMSHRGFAAALLTMHIAIILGYLLNGPLEELGLKLPLFVTSLLMAIVLTNTVPRLFPRLPWPAGTPALALISDFSLGVFIAMSLMGMQLAALSSVAGPLLVVLAAQVVAALAYVVFVLYPLLGRNYLAVVLSSGFIGFCLGATPTAVANMTAVTKAHGPARAAFILLPLVGAFFVDITNSFVIRWFLSG